jgi:hypothetical protein
VAILPQEPQTRANDTQSASQKSDVTNGFLYCCGAWCTNRNFTLGRAVRLRSIVSFRNRLSSVRNFTPRIRKGANASDALCTRRSRPRAWSPRARGQGPGRRWHRCSTAPRQCAPRICATLSAQFASQSLVDEIAAATGTDPAAFRLRYMKASRGIAVVKAAAEHAG